MKIILAAVLAGAVVATTNAQTVGEPREQRELRSLQVGTSVNTCKKYIAVGGTCSDTSSCVATAFCSYPTNKCVQRPGTNAKCGNDIFCAAGLGCFFNTTTFTPVGCRALPVAGEECLWGEFGQRLCASGLRCYSEGTTNAKNVCRDATTVKNGACSVDLLCPAGQGCFLGATTSSCVPSRNENENCAGNTPGICKPGLYCKPDVNKCVKVGANGADCNLSGSDSCASGLSCVYERPFPLLPKVFRCRTTPTTEGANCVDRCGNLAGTSPAVPLNCRQ